MKRRTLSIFLVLVLLCVYLPQYALFARAADDSNTYDGPGAEYAAGTAGSFAEEMKSLFERSLVTLAAQTYTITFDSLGGIASPKPQTKTHNEALTLTMQIPSRTFTLTFDPNGGTVSPTSQPLSCKFQEWNTQANGSGTAYKAGAKYTDNKSVTLYAQWTNPTAGTLPTAQWTNHSFLGWFTTPTNGGSRITSSTTVTGDMTVYARWSNSPVTTYQVSYDANGGKNAPDPQIKEENVALTLSTQKPTKSYTITYNANGGSVSTSSKTVDCTFNNWNTASNGSGKTYNSGVPYTANANVRLYAQWTNPTAGTLPTPTQEGYTFDGWYTAASGGSPVTSTTVVTKNMTVYARWAPVTVTTYSIRYNGNGGTNVPKTQTKLEGVALQLSDEKPTKSYSISYNANGGGVTLEPTIVDCSFRNWNTAANGSKETFNPGDYYKDDASVTLYAQWTDPIAGTLQRIDRDNYIFDGWFTAAKGGTQITGTSSITHNITVYAHWIWNGSDNPEKCGPDLYWSFDEGSGVLTITGSGEMRTWSDYTKVPWYENAGSIRSISFPAELTSIGASAFKNCKGLTSVTIPAKVESIGVDAFSGCSKLRSVRIPDNVTLIGKRAFEDCTSLKEAIIGNGVKNIEEGVFRDCSALTSVKIYNPDCNIYSNSTTLGDPEKKQTVIYGVMATSGTGEKYSTAQQHAEKYGYTFKEIEPQEIKPSDDSFRFDDVKDPTVFYFEPVYWAYLHDPQITTGTDSTHFGPGRTCTRAQIVTFLWRASGEPEPKSTGNPFTDVKPGAYYYKAVLWAVEKGITNGVSPTAFGPDRGCTRGQVVTFLWRSSGQPVPRSSSNPFTDVQSGAYYFNAVLWAVDNNITNGTSPVKFSPDATCTRGQIVTFLYRAMA